MHKHLKTTASILALCLLSAPAQSQNLPWQQPNAAPAPQPMQQYAPPMQQQYQQPMQQPEDPDAREQDDRQLNSLATDFYHISGKDPRVVAKLSALQKRVKSFRSTLRHRQYDADDIAKDAAKLEGRISAQKKKLAKK